MRKKESVFNIYLYFIVYILHAFIHAFRWNIEYVASGNSMKSQFFVHSVQEYTRENFWKTAFKQFEGISSAQADPRTTLITGRPT